MLGAGAVELPVGQTHGQIRVELVQNHDRDDLEDRRQDADHAHRRSAVRFEEQLANGQAVDDDAEEHADDQGHEENDDRQRRHDLAVIVVRLLIRLLDTRHRVGTLFLAFQLSLELRARPLFLLLEFGQVPVEGNLALPPLPELQEERGPERHEAGEEDRGTVVED